MVSLSRDCPYVTNQNSQQNLTSAYLITVNKLGVMVRHFLDIDRIARGYEPGLKAMPHVTISSTMAFNVAKIASVRASLTISLTKSLRVAGP